MKLQIDDGSWINTNHITVYYIGRNYCVDRYCNGINCCTLNGDEYLVLNPEHDEVNQHLLDTVINVLCAWKLTHHTMTQEELWREINRMK